MRKLFFLLILCNLSSSCSKYVVKKERIDLTTYSIDNKYIFFDKSIIAFNGGFNQDNYVRVFQNEEIIFEGELKTDNRIGLAKVINIPIQETEIHFKGQKKALRIRQNDLLNYKFVNISFSNGKYTIVFTNMKKNYR